MRVQFDPRGEPALRLELSRSEVPLLRATLERASFIDTRPDLQAAVFDFIERLLPQVPDGGDPGARSR